MLTPAHVMGEVERRRESVVDPVRFYWVVVDHGSRDEFAQTIRELGATRPVIPVVQRIAGFTESNSVMNDLLAALEAGRRDIETAGMRDLILEHGHVDVVLISRRELALAVTSSPLVLPSWFPISSETEVAASIDDLTWTTTLPLAAPEACVDDIQRLLYDLDTALLDRVSAVGIANQQNTRDLLGAVRKKSESSLSLGDFVDRAQSVLAEVSSVTHYRLSSGGPTMVARLWNATYVTHSGDRARLAAALVTALQVDREDVRDHKESIVAVLTRSRTPIRDSAVRWAFDVIAATGAACQLATAAAHAGEFGLYPVHLLVSLSRDLRRALDGFVELLERLE